MNIKVITLRSQVHEWWEQTKLVHQQEQVASQNLSPGSSLYWCNLNWMSETELLTLTLIAVLGNEIIRNNILRCELLLQLPQKIQRAQKLTTLQKALLLRLIEDRLKRKLPLYENRQQALFKYFPHRKVKGLLSDSVVLRKISRRLRPRIVKPSLKRQLLHGTPTSEPSRVRGYRDHGSARPAHRWFPTTDWTLTRAQWTKEQLEKLDLEFYEVFLLRPFKICFST